MAVFLMGLVWAGCKQEAKVAADNKTIAATATDINPVGIYALATVDGNKVPCTVQHEGHTMTIRSGSFVINADGTCSSKVSLAGRDAAIEFKATYTRAGSKRVASAIMCDGVSTAAVVFAPEYGNEDDHPIRSYLCSGDCAGSTGPDRLAPEA